MRQVSRELHFRVVVVLVARGARVPSNSSKDTRNLVIFTMWIFFCPPVVNITNKATQLSKDAFRSAGCLFPYRWGFVAVQCGRASPRKWRLLLFRCRRIERRCQFRFSSSSEAAKHNVGNGNVSNNDSST